MNYIRAFVVSMLLLGFATPVLAADTTKPTLGAITPTSAVVGKATTFSLTVSDNVGISSCSFYVSSVKKGAMTLSSGKASYTHTFTVPGRHYIYVLCRDTSGNFRATPMTRVNVTGTASGGTEKPELGTLLPDYAYAGIATRYHIDVTDDVGIDFCTFYPVGTTSQEMELGDDEAFLLYTYTVIGKHDAYVLCRDVDGNFSTSEVTEINVQAGFLASESAEPGDLVKTECPEAVYVNHACTTVYYYADDGKRHAFPNEKVYFSWYANYASLKIVSTGFMAALPLGGNVTYKPGVKMTKFIYDPRVFMVSRGAVLRPIASENAAVEFYGSAWNTHVDDISDVFYRDYTFGDPIYGLSDYDAAEEQDVALIDDSF